MTHTVLARLAGLSGTGVVDEAVRRGIETADAALQAQPHLAAAVSVDRVDVVRNQAVGIPAVVPVMLEASGALVEPDQTAATPADPEITCGIPVDAVDVGSCDRASFRSPSRGR